MADLPFINLSSSAPPQLLDVANTWSPRSTQVGRYQKYGTDTFLGRKGLRHDTPAASRGTQDRSAAPLSQTQPAPQGDPRLLPSVVQGTLRACGKATAVPPLIRKQVYEAHTEAGLRTLDLSDHPLTSETLPYVVYAIQTGDFSRVVLGEGTLGDASAKALQRAIAENPSVTSVDLTSCSVPRVWRERIGRTLAASRHRGGGTPPKRGELPLISSPEGDDGSDSSTCSSTASGSVAAGAAAQGESATLTAVGAGATTGSRLGDCSACSRRCPPRAAPVRRLRPRRTDKSQSGVERLECNERCKLAFLEDCSARHLSATHRAVRAAWRWEMRDNASRDAVSRLAGHMSDEEDRTRPRVIVQELAGRMFLVAEEEALQRRCVASAEWGKRGTIRRKSGKLLKTALDIHHQRQAQYKYERETLRVEEHTDRFDVVCEMLEERAELGSLLASIQLSALDDISGRAAKEEEERRRQRQRQADQERERAWKDECQKQEARRVEAERLVQRSKLLSQEEKCRKFWSHGKVGKEPQVRQLLEGLHVAYLEITRSREKVGVAHRAYQALLAEKPELRLVMPSESQTPSVHFINSSDAAPLDPATRIECFMGNSWASRVQQSIDAVHTASEALSKIRQGVCASIAETLRVSQEKILDPAKVSLEWHHSMVQECRAAQSKEAVPETPPMLGPEEIEPVGRCKTRVWGGAIWSAHVPAGESALLASLAPGVTIADDDSVSISLSLSTDYVVAPGEQDGCPAVLLPTDGSASLEDIDAVLASIHYRTSKAEGPEPHLTSNDARRRLPTMKHVQIDVEVLVAGDVEQDPPRQYCMLRTTKVATILLQEKHLRVLEEPAFSFREGEDEKVLLDVPIRTDTPITFSPHPSGVYHCTSSFADTVLTVEFTDNFTRPDQVYFKKTPDVLWIDQSRLMSKGNYIGRVDRGTFKRYHPPGGGTKIPAIRGERDLGNRPPGQIQQIVFTEEAEEDDVRLLLESLRYLNVSSDPREGPREIVVRLSDQMKLHSTSVTVRVSVEAEDDPTVVTLPDKRMIFRCPVSPDITEEAAIYVPPVSQPVAPHAFVQDVDTRFFSGGHLRATISSGYRRGDRLFIRSANQPHAPSMLMRYPSVSCAPRRIVRPGEQTVLQCFHSLLDDGGMDEDDVVTRGNTVDHSGFHTRPDPAAAAEGRVSPRGADPQRQHAQFNQQYHNKITCYELPKVDGYTRVQVYYGPDVLALATFVPPREVKPSTYGLDVPVSPRASSRCTASDLMPSWNDCVEIHIQFSELPHGVTSIRGAQELLQCIHFGTPLISPKEGVRHIDIAMFIGNTVKKIQSDQGCPAVRVVPHNPNKLVHDVVNIRVAPSLLRIPPKYTEFSYLEGSGFKRLASFDLPADDDVYNDPYNGLILAVSIVEGFTPDDVLSVRSGADSDGLEFHPRDSVSTYVMDAFAAHAHPARRDVPQDSPGFVAFASLAEESQDPASRGASPGSPGTDSASDISSSSWSFQGRGNRGRAASPGADISIRLPDCDSRGGTPGGECVTVSDVCRMAALRGVGFADLPWDDDDDSEAFEEVPRYDALTLLAKCRRDLRKGTREKVFSRTHALIAARLRELREQEVADQLQRAKTAYIEIRRADGVLGYVEVGRGTLKVIFNPTPVVKRKDVMTVMRCISYMSDSDNPAVSRKVFHFTVSESSGMTPSSTIILGDIVAVDNPTSILMTKDRLFFRNLVSGGEPLALFPLGEALLDDPDTDDFGKGAIILEGQGLAKHDVFTLMLPEQQQEAVLRHNITAAARGIPVADPPVIYTEKNGDKEGAVLLRMDSETGPVIGKAIPQKPGGLVALVINFCTPPEMKKISLALASCVLNCITFSSCAPDTIPERPILKSLRLRVSDGINKEDGKTSFTLEYSGPLIQVPGMVSTLAYTEKTTQMQYLVPKACVSLMDKVHLVTGFVEARMVSEPSPEDMLVLHHQKRSQYTMKDGVILNCNEFLGRLQVFSKTWVRLEFTSQSKSVDKKRLQDLVRLFAWCAADDPPNAKYADASQDQRRIPLDEVPSPLPSEQKVVLVRASDGRMDVYGSPQATSIACFLVMQPEKSKKGRVKAAVNAVKLTV